MRGIRGVGMYPLPNRVFCKRDVVLSSPLKLACSQVGEVPRGSVAVAENSPTSFLAEKLHVMRLGLFVGVEVGIPCCPAFLIQLRLLIQCG